MKKQKIRILFYVLLVALIFIGIFVRKNSVVKERQAKIVSQTSEWLENGKPVSVEKILKDKFVFIAKITAQINSARELVSYVTKDVLDMLRPGQKFQVAIDGKVEGFVKEIEASVDMSTGLFKVLLETNKNVKNGKFKHLPVEVYTKVLSNVMSIPNEAIVKEGNNEYVFKYKNKIAKKKKIKKSYSNGNRSVIKKGIKPNDLIVVGGIAQIKDQDKVGIYECVRCEKRS